MRAAKVQASLRIRAVSPEPLLLAHTSSESRGIFRQKARSLAPRNGWACAVEICHDGMLEDTNSLDGAHLLSHRYETQISIGIHFWEIWARLTPVPKNDGDKKTSSKNFEFSWFCKRTINHQSNNSLAFQQHASGQFSAIKPCLGVVFDPSVILQV